MHTLSIGQIALRLFAASILGSLVGWNRQRKEEPAGLRTHMLVCVGSTLIMIVSAFGFDDILGHPDVVLDPSRMAAQVVSGIGFLGAGAIFFFRQQVVRGLTTAAGLWSVAAIGLAIGGGMYFAGILATTIILLILVVIKQLERRIFKNGQLKTILLTIHTKQISLTEIEYIIKDKGLEIDEVVLNKAEHDDVYQMKLTFENETGKTSLLAIVEQLHTKSGISEIVLNS